MNPNNCKTCDYTKLNGNREGHCYMFRDEPTDVCMQHTGRNKPLHAFGDSLSSAMADDTELRDELIAAGLVTPNNNIIELARVQIFRLIPNLQIDLIWVGIASFFT